MTNVGLLETQFGIWKTTFKLLYDHYSYRGGCSAGCYDSESNVKMPKGEDVIKYIHMFMFFIYVINGINFLSALQILRASKLGY